jgi:hypothetical protein
VGALAAVSIDSILNWSLTEVQGTCVGYDSAEEPGQCHKRGHDCVLPSG